MAKTSDLVLAAVVLAGAYIAYNAFRQKAWTTEQTVNAISSAGGNISKTSTGVFWNVPGGVVKLDSGNFTPNFAQGVLVALDKIIPGDYLTRKVFGV